MRIKIFEKFLCKHKWETHAKKGKIITERYSNEVIKEYTHEIIICKHCGKVKNIYY